MKTYEIHHIDNSDRSDAARDIRCFGSEHAASIPAVRYRMVARMKAESLDEVFARSQHAHSTWTDADDVQVLAERVRSTSVGDIIIVNGRSYMVDPTGFSEVAVS